MLPNPTTWKPFARKPGNPRSPRHIIAQGTLRISISLGKVVVTDDHGLIVHVHDARAVVIHEASETVIYGATEELTKN